MINRALQILILQTILILSCSASEIREGDIARLENSYQIEEFSRLNGLNAFLIKALYQTNDGYVYVGTDSQLIVHDGENWKEIPPSGSTILIKYMLQRKNGDFLVLADTNLYLIEKTKTGYKTTSYLDYSDEDLHFSKLLYEASDGSLWIAAHSYVFQLKDGKLEKFQVPESSIPSRNYLHTCFILEKTNGNIAVISQTGQAYQFEGNQLKRIEWEGPKEVFKVLPSGNKDEFYLGTDRGFEILKWADQELNESTVEIEVGWVSDIAITKQKDIYFSTFQKTVFTAEKAENGWRKELIKEFEANVFRMFPDNNDAVWMLMENRIYRCHKNPVSLLGNSKPTPFLKAFSKNGILHADDTKLLFTDQSGKTIVLHSFESPITTADYSEGKIVVSLRNGKYLLLNEAGQVLYSIDAGEQSTNLHIDKKGNVWGNVLNKEGVIKINFPESYQYFGGDHIPTLVSCIVSSDKGDILIAGNTPENFLFRWEEGKQEFQNIGKIKGPRVFSSNDFGINEITFKKDGSVVLGTAIGILESKNDGFYWLDLGAYSSHDFLSLKYDAVNDAYWGTSWVDAFFIKNGEVTHYDNINGLKHNPNNYRNTVLSNGVFWIGTYEGIAGIKTHTDNLNTNLPRLHAVILEGRKIQELPSKLSNRQDLYIEFKSPNFGVRATKYRFDLHNAKTGDSTLTTNETGVLSLSRLEKGDYTLTIRSKGVGNYNWSDPIEFEFSVFSVFEKQLMLTLVWAGILVYIIIIALSVYSKANAKRIHKLDQLVQERTEEITTKNQLLASSNQVRERMLSIVSHDLRGPIGNILNLQTFISEKLDEGNLPEALELSILANSETEKTYELLENLLAWANYQGDKLKPALEVLSLKKTISTTIDLLRQRIIEKDLHLDANFEDVSINTDKNFLNTILRNLLSNAVKFSSPNGSIRVTAQEKGSSVEIAIIDDGPGMDEETVNKILNKNNFYSTVGSLNESGTGLGITVCVELLEKLGSELKIQSKPGNGTTMSFSLENSSSLTKEV